MQIGLAARARKPIDPKTFAMIDDAAAKSPLAPEPFLVRGVQEENAGHPQNARLAFAAAQARDPRSLPAAYFLANYYFHSGDALAGLQQTIVLARLSPGGIGAVAPFVATYTQNPRNWPKIRALFRSQPEIENSVLEVLARDPRNTDAMLAVADAAHRDPSNNWVRMLLSSLVANGEYARAHAIWTSVGRGSAGNQLLYDSNFSSPEAPPPFNWALTTSTVGLAERQPGQRLHVIFYGNEDGVLASQLVLLPPGTYRLQMQLGGSPVHPELLHWSIRCDGSDGAFGNIAIDQAASAGWTFQVPANCPAQWIQLSGRSADVAQQAEATITGLSLTRAGGTA
jgi:hypothetical protein